MTIQSDLQPNEISDVGARMSRRPARTHRRAPRLAAGLIVLALGAPGVGLVGATSASASTDPSNVACDGGFESPVVAPPWKNYAAGAIIGSCWTVGAGNIDLIHDSVAAEGSQFVDLDGTNADGEIHQTIATAPGASYTVSFDLSGNPSGNPVVKTVVVTFGSSTRTYTFNTSGMTWSTLHWTPIVFTATASASATLLSIKSTDAANGHNSFGGLIDAVSVTS